MSYSELNIEKPFPIVINQTDFTNSVGDKEEIRFMKQSNGSVVCSYVVSMEGTFDNMFARECRGIVFDENGLVISRPLHKFFNVGEKETTRAENVDFSKVHRVMDKRDGSMIHTVRTGKLSPFEYAPDDNVTAQASFDIKSKKSYESDVAKQARKFIVENRNFANFCESCIQNDATAIFEWTSPTARIVLPYAKDELKLLHVRDNEDGQYWSEDYMRAYAEMHKIPVVDSINLNGDNFIQNSKGETIKYTLVDTSPLVTQLMSLAETLVGIEGWIVQFNNGDMVKIKTKDYMVKHRAMTFLRERDIAELVLDEQLDDTKALLVQEGCSIERILEIEKDVVTCIEKIISEVDKNFKQIQIENMTKKEAALRFGPSGQKFEYFSMLMTLMEGKREPDYKNAFRKYIMPERYSLKQINLIQSTD